MKKMLIVGLFTSVMLFVPMTSVVGVSDTSQSEEDCGCEIVSNPQLVKVKRLFNRLVVYTKILLLLSKYDPMIVEKSQKFFEIFDTDRFLNNDIICLSLFYILLLNLWYLSWIDLMLYNLREGSILFMMFLSVHKKIENIINNILDLMEELECEIDIPISS